tara:strand:- start:586 stop:1164 length:579 start_codon:yes stop_codon:yes gene_type:complete
MHFCSFTTYINQIFGDENIINKIMELYPSKSLRIKSVNDTLYKLYYDDDAYHFVCENIDDGSIIDSRSVSGNKVQNNRLHPNDGLCQSYALLTYLKTCNKWHCDYNSVKTVNSQCYAEQKHCELQNKIIKMYKELLLNEDLCIEICSFNFIMIDKQGRHLMPIKDNIIGNIKYTLENWDYSINMSNLNKGLM